MKEKPYSLIDYVRWRGDLSFKEKPFNDVDNCIFCEMIYLDMKEPVKNLGNAVTFKAIYDYIKEKDIYTLKTLLGKQQDFIEAVAYSKRFGSCKVIDYTDVFNAQTQFCAACFQIDSKVMYIAFRGTDNSIVGWKEDFMFSFTHTSVQDNAKQYVMTHVKAGKRYYVGGHSKGANLAVYACANVDKRRQERIMRVFMNDGPGFCEEVFDVTKIHAIANKITRIMPTYDIIGQLFYDETIQDSYYVNSIGQGIYQHDLVTWCTDISQLNRAKQLDSSCHHANETFRVWIETMSLEERKALTEALFNSLMTDNTVTIQEAIGKGVRYYISVVQSFLTSGSVESAGKLPKIAIETSGKMLKMYLECILNDKD